MRKDTELWCRNRVRVVALNPAFGLALALFGWLLCSPDRLPDPAALPERDVRIEGTIAEPPQQGSDFLYFELVRVEILDPSRKPFRGRIAVTVNLPDAGPAVVLGWGERIALTSRLREPSHYRTPGVADGRVRALRRGIVRVAALKSLRQIERVAPASGWKELLDSLRQTFLERCRTHLSAPVLALVQAGFLGNRRALDADLMSDLYTTQLLHLFSISGFHVTILLALLRWLTIPLGRIGWLPATALTWVYVLLIGCPLPAVRAALAALLAILIWQIGVRGRFFNTMGMVALILMIAWPPAARTAGFQFSFLALAAIGAHLHCIRPRLQAAFLGAGSVFQQRVRTALNLDAVLGRRVRFACEQWLEPWRQGGLIPFWKGAVRVVRFPVQWLFLTLLIQLMTLPLTLHYSNRLAWGQLPSNLLLGPLFSVMLVLIVLCFGLFPTPLAPLVMALLEGVGRLWLWLLRTVSESSPVSWLPHPSPELALVVVAGTGILIWLSRRPLSSALLTGSSLSLWLAISSGSGGEGPLQVTFLDVGQGDAIHLRYPDGSNALIDTGGLIFADDEDYLARSVVARYLWEEGVDRLRFVLLSHDHLDHVQGVKFLLQAFAVEALWVGPDHSLEGFPKWLPVARLERGDDFLVAGVFHRILHPAGGRGEEGRSRNQQSLVLEMSSGGTRILFPGDVGEREERQFESDARSLTLLKVPHHGSSGSNSRTFLRAFSPLISVVSSGRNNPFGHPAPAAVKRFDQLGLPLFSTSDWGSIRFRTDGLHWGVNHWSGGWQPLPAGGEPSLWQPQ